MKNAEEYLVTANGVQVLPKLPGDVAHDSFVCDKFIFSANLKIHFSLGLNGCVNPEIEHYANFRPFTIQNVIYCLSSVSKNSG